MRIFPVPAYEALPPPEVHMMSSYLRRAGYFCTNNPKEDYVKSIWPGGEPPLAETPAVERGAKIKLSCPTEGAQLAYQWVGDTEEASQNWTIYQAPVEQQIGDTLLVQAYRIGYRPSEVVRVGF